MPPGLTPSTVRITYSERSVTVSKTTQRQEIQADRKEIDRLNEHIARLNDQVVKTQKRMDAALSLTMTVTETTTSLTTSLMEAAAKAVETAENMERTISVAGRLQRELDYVKEQGFTDTEHLTLIAAQLRDLMADYGFASPADAEELHELVEQGQAERIDAEDARRKIEDLRRDTEDVRRESE